MKSHSSPKISTWNPIQGPWCHKFWSLPQVPSQRWHLRPLRPHLQDLCFLANGGGFRRLKECSDGWNTWEKPLVSKQVYMIGSTITISILYIYIYMVYILGLVDILGSISTFVYDRGLNRTWTATIVKPIQHMGFTFLDQSVNQICFYYSLKNMGIVAKIYTSIYCRVVINTIASTLVCCYQS